MGIPQAILGYRDFLSPDRISAYLQHPEAAREKIGSPSEPLLIFANSWQQTWLVATYDRLRCILDDVRLVEPKECWSMLRSELVEGDVVSAKIIARDKSTSYGLLDFSDRHRNWLYNKGLFGAGGVVETITDLIERNMTDTGLPRVVGDSREVGTGLGSMPSREGGGFARKSHQGVFAIGGAVLLLVFLGGYLLPSHKKETTISLSSVGWEPKISLLAPPTAGQKRQGITALVYFHGFRQAWPQNEIDELYRALKPTEETRKEFDFIGPARVKKLFDGGEMPTNRSRLMSTLREDLAINKAIIVDLTRHGTRLSIRSEAIDISSGKAIATTTESGVIKAEVAAKLRAAAAFLSAALTPESH